jgi:hypothetical protein
VLSKIEGSKDPRGGIIHNPVIHNFKLYIIDVVNYV